VFRARRELKPFADDGIRVEQQRAVVDRNLNSVFIGKVTQRSPRRNKFERFTSKFDLDKVKIVRSRMGALRDNSTTAQCG
jgi:hypothetical protein